MYRLINEIGNLVIETENERKKDRLLDLGYKLDKKEKSLDDMKVSELEDFAKENNIDLKDCENKTEKLNKIKEMLKSN